MTATKDIESAATAQPAPKHREATTCRFIFRSVIFGLCLILFLWHGYFLISFYLAFNTQITSNLTFADTFDLPGVTLCFKNDQLTSSGPQSPVADEVFKRYFKEKEKETAEIKCSLMIPTLNQVTGSVDSSPIACKDIAPILESVNYGMGQKCYTFFSRIGMRRREQRSMRVRDPRSGLLNSRDGDLLRLEIDFGRNTLIDDIEASVSIHQGTELPNSWQKVSKIKPGNKYMASFSKIVEKRLPSPYVTACKNYGYREEATQSEVGNSSSPVAMDRNTARSRYECIDQCLLDLYRQKCNCLPADINIRRQLLKPSDSFCTNAKCQHLRVYGQDVCESLPACKPECKREMYDFVTETSDSGTSQVLYHYINSQGRGKVGPYAGRPMVPGHLQTYGLHVSR